MDEIASVTPLFAGVDYQRLEGYKSLQWPVAADGTDEPLLYTKRFNFSDGKARLFPLVWREAPEHIHEGHMTYRSPGVKENTPDTFVEISPELAEERGIQSGSLVQITSRRG